MEREYLEAPGNFAPAAQPTGLRARELARLLQARSIEFASFVECRAGAHQDTVIFDVEVELPQVRVHAIRTSERIAAIFDRSDQTMPEVLALRADFPRVPHLNLRLKEFPRSLCLYEQPFRELKRQWTAPRFVERVRTWLALTAKGKLHDEDQPLEPLLFGYTGHIVLPANLLESADGKAFERLQIVATDMTPGKCFLMADPPVKMPSHDKEFVVSVHVCSPQAHGIIRFSPRSLEELATLMRDAQADPLATLRQRIEGWKDDCGVDKQKAARFLNSPVILVVVFPKTRSVGGPVESSDVWAFITPSTVREIGIDIGLWTVIDGNLGREPFPPEDRIGRSIQLDLLNPVFRLRPADAAVLNASSHDTPDIRIVAIGAGALGSQTMLNLARAGFGRWTTIDNDRMLPHNLARHALQGYAVGFHKAEIFADSANSITDGEPRFSAIVADILEPGEMAEKIHGAFKEADAIVDLSASVAVARHLVEGVESSARRLSVFLNPTGDDLVLLAEDAVRSRRLDMLEMQYYRALITDKRLAGHFRPADSRRRYGQSCRDVTFQISQELVSLHAAVASRCIRQSVAHEAAQITVWRADEGLGLTRVDIETSTVVEFRVGDWSIRIDSYLLHRLNEVRQSKLPNETGGVLIGSFDLDRRIAYLVETLPSPPDSDEWPTLYIRGCRGLKRRVQEILEATDGALHYVGEWHSHPAGCSTAPSTDDLKVFVWITEAMDADGFPALMMIVGDPGRVSCFLGRMEQSENLLPSIAV